MGNEEKWKELEPRMDKYVNKHPPWEKDGVWVDPWRDMQRGWFDGFCEGEKKQKARADDSFNWGYFAGANWLAELIRQEKGDVAKAKEIFNKEPDRVSCPFCEEQKKRADLLSKQNDRLQLHLTEMNAKLEKVRRFININRNECEDGFQYCLNEIEEIIGDDSDE